MWRIKMLTEIFDFNPRPPWGGRLYLFVFVRLLGAFQSTPSVGRATFLYTLGFPIFINFNPRPPWGGRHARFASCGMILQ